jgi:hypothetical protein
VNDSIDRDSAPHRSPDAGLASGDWREGDLPVARTGNCIHGYPRGVCSRCRTTAHDTTPVPTSRPSAAETASSPARKRTRTSTGSRIDTQLIAAILDVLAPLDEQGLLSNVRASGVVAARIADITAVLEGNPHLFEMRGRRSNGVRIWSLRRHGVRRLRLSTRGPWADGSLGRALRRHR